VEITDGLDLIDPATYGKSGAPHEAWTRLRRVSPVHLCTPPDFEAYWAITRHADICDISRRPETFLNAPGIVVMSNLQKEIRDQGGGLVAMRTIIEMDPPEHRKYRKIASPWFTPRAVGRIDQAVEASARELVDKLAANGGEGECDFAVDIATAHPLRILSTILGVPRESEPLILKLTNQLFGSEDPELQRSGETPQKAIEELGAEIYTLFSGIVDDRRANPRDDLATVLAQGEIDGAPIGPMELFGYYLITFTAGHDTTKNALAGGMKAFLDNPGEMAKLQAHPELVRGAVEEIVRWTTPVNYMKRTAARDVEVRGQAIKKGDNLALFYASANRDEEVFDAPFAFRIDRDPNPHIGFGIGEHFCLGANLARKSQVAFWRELSRRLEMVEPAGEAQHIRSNFVVGYKHLPIRYRVRAAV